MDNSELNDCQLNIHILFHRDKIRLIMTIFRYMVVLKIYIGTQADQLHDLPPMSPMFTYVSDCRSR